MMTYQAALRIAATIAVSVLASMQVLYPSFTWIAVATAALGAVGIHAIPAISQATSIAVPAITTEVKNMETSSELENPIGVNGMALMGLTPPVVAPVAPVEPTPVAETAPTVTPEQSVDTSNQPTPVTVQPVAQKTAMPVSEPVTGDNSELASLVTAAANALSAVAAKLSGN